MARFKTVVTIISEAFKCPIGPRLRRGTPMPMEKLYQERGGYYFDPETELELANECAQQFENYITAAETLKKKFNKK